MFILLGILIGLVTYILWERRHIYRLSWQLPGPFAIPIVGNALSVHPNNILSYFDRLTKTYKGPFRLWLGPMLAVIITDTENVEIVMKSKDCLDKPKVIYKVIRDAIAADGLFTSKADEWKVHRKLVSPTINQQTLRIHLPIFNANMRNAISSLPTNGQFFDIYPFISKCKMTMFLEAALGLELEPEAKQRYLKQLPQCIEIAAKRSLQPLYLIDFIWNMTENAKILKSYIQEGREIFEKLVQDKNEKDNDSSSFIERLLDISKDNPKFTIDDVFTETLTILGGAVDTSTMSFTFVALMLVMHPEYQEKVFEEVYKVMPDKHADLSQSDLEQLTFTELCLRETWRLFPTVSLIGRESNKPIRLKNNVVIPAGVPIIVGIRQLHLQEKYYGPTAHMFNPYRYLDEKIKNLPPAAYITFGYGPRNCIGYNYAQTAVKCFTAHLIRNYRITTTYTNIDQLHIIQNISIKLLGKYMIKVEPRSV